MVLYRFVILQRYRLEDLDTSGNYLIISQLTPEDAGVTLRQIYLFSYFSLNLSWHVCNYSLLEPHLNLNESLEPWLKCKVCLETCSRSGVQHRRAGGPGWLRTEEWQNNRNIKIYFKWATTVAAAGPVTQSKLWLLQRKLFCSNYRFICQQQHYIMDNKLQRGRVINWVPTPLQCWDWDNQTKSNTATADLILDQHQKMSCAKCPSG